MRTLKFLYIAFLLLVPAERVAKRGPERVSGDFATCTDSRKQNKEMRNFENYYRPNYDKNQEKNEVPIKINYESSKEEKYVDGKKIKVTEGELCTEEVEAVKKVAAKLQAAKNEKINKPEYSTYRNLDQVIGVDFNKNKFSCAAEPKEGSTLCADCEKCEVQVKANGEGILLKCKECRQVPPNEVVFPTGNNRRIVKLP